MEFTTNYLQDMYDYRDGGLYYKYAPSKRIKAGGRVGSVGAAGYRQVCVAGKMYLEHRLIWTWHFGTIPEGMVVNHIDCNPLNNDIDNLEICTQKENLQRGKKQLTQNYKCGIRQRGNKFIGYFYIGKNQVYGGTFDTLEACETATKLKQKQVRSLLNKLSKDTLDSN